MIDNSAQILGGIESAAPALRAQPDAYSVLMNAIARASNDPARLRELIYALASQSFKPGASARDPVPDPVELATNLVELEQAFQFEHAIFRIERQASNTEGNADANNKAAVDILRDQPVAPLIEPRITALSGHLPTFLDPVARVALEAAEAIADHAPMPRRRAPFSFGQLAVASIVGLVLYAGGAIWLKLGRPVANGTAVASAAASGQKHMSPTIGAETVGSGHPEMRQTQGTPVLNLPFPMPERYGVYAASNGRIAALEQLPVDVPPARSQMSAEIRTPSRTPVSGTDLKFVVIKPGLSNHAAESAQVRAVARVDHALVFVNGRPTTLPVPSEWRVREKPYELNISPLEGDREMLLVEPAPGLVLPPGRYALVLNGEGYDFTVPGPVTALEQCLEQFQVQNGVILSECPKS
jgi:hypothetical protein